MTAQSLVHFSLGVDWIELTTAVGALYLWGLRRARRAGTPHPPRQVAAFYGSLAALLLAFVTPLDAYDNVSFFAHMAQHLILMFVVAPLFALAAPITLALRAVPPGIRAWLQRILESRPATLLAQPWAALAVFGGIQAATLLPPFYDAALRSGGLHLVEHALYLSTGFLFWWPIVGVDPPPRRLSVSGRLVLLMLAIPVLSAAGIILLVAGAPLYEHYARLPAPWGGHAALLSQRKAGVILLAAGQGALVIAGVLIFVGHVRKRGSPRAVVQES